jgi:predicted HicB family RNase H-like nuclease
MEYKGYSGEFYFDETRLIFQGKVSNIKYPLTFKGRSMESLHQDFQDVIDDYIAWCKKRGVSPEKPLPCQK